MVHEITIVIERKVILLPTWARKITCQRFDWMLQLSSGRKWKKCVQTLLFIAIHYWGYTSLEVKGWWGLLLPPCLLITAVQQPATSSPPSRLKCSSAGVIWMCRASFTFSLFMQQPTEKPLKKILIIMKVEVMLYNLLTWLTQITWIMLLLAL